MDVSWKKLGNTNLIIFDRLLFNHKNRSDTLLDGQKLDVSNGKIVGKMVRLNAIDDDIFSTILKTRLGFLFIETSTTFINLDKESHEPSLIVVR